jgi:outer membrane protein TolC
MISSFKYSPTRIPGKAIRPIAKAYPYIIFALTGLAALFATRVVNAAEKTPAPGPRLSIENYLTQVEGGNKSVSAAKAASAGADLRAGEASLLYSPVLDAKAQWLRDRRQSPFLSYDRFINDTFDIGISQQTPWGLSARLSYDLTQTGYQGLGRPIYYYGAPRIDLTLDLWRNLFGSEMRSQQEALESAALATKYSQSYQAKAIRAAAETAYIQLAAARELDEMNRSSFERAKEIYEWTSRRARLNLSDSSDLFQAEANLEATRLSLQSGADSLRSACRAFNQARGIDGDEVTEILALPDPKTVETPQRAEMRDDVRAAREAQRAAAAQAQIGVEKNKPTLEVFGTYARNSQQIGKDDAISKSFSAAQPTTAVGVRLSMPLAVGLSNDARHGYAQEKIAAETLAEQKTFDQEIEWKDLVQKLAEAKSRLAVAEKLADIQKKKAANERNRLKRGRTTTYQSLIFETDYNQAENRRIQSQSEVLSLLAKMKTFGG